MIRVSVVCRLFSYFDEIITQYVEIWDLYLVIYYDTCDMAILEILLFVDEVLCSYSAASFEKLFMHVFRFIEDVTSKFLNDCIIRVIYRFKDLRSYNQGTWVGYHMILHHVKENMFSRPRLWSIKLPHAYLCAIRRPVSSRIIHLSSSVGLIP